MSNDFITKVLHARPPKADVHGSLHTPVYDNASFEFGTAEEMELAFRGKKPAHAYTRITNPTVEFLETKLRVATGAASVTAMASGMAAISNTMLALFGQGDEIIATTHMFGNTYSLFEKTLKPWGFKGVYADLCNIDEVASNITSKTKAIFIETITNPQQEVPDIAALSALAKANNILLIADTTMTPPYLFDAKAHGVDIEVISSTKYISGGATSVGGIVIDYGSYRWDRLAKLEAPWKQYGPMAFTATLKREVFRNLGACLSPHNAYLQSIGLDTLPLRLDRSCANALAVAQYLQAHPSVKAVHYPGLASSPHHETAKRQFNDKFGGIVCFELESQEQCFEMMNKLKIIRRATNVNDNKTLIIHPASTIFSEYSPEQLVVLGVPPTLIRLSVGIEGLADIVEDLQSAIN